jgi:hypothetical protein
MKSHDLRGYTYLDKFTTHADIHTLTSHDLPVSSRCHSNVPDNERLTRCCSRGRPPGTRLQVRALLRYCSPLPTPSPVQQVDLLCIIYSQLATAFRRSSKSIFFASFILNLQLLSDEVQGPVCSTSCC